MSNRQSTQPEEGAGGHPATPLQQGMLFHAVSAQGSGVDIEQIRFDFAQELGVERFIECWQSAVDRHPILRAAFRWQDVPVPRVVVGNDVELPVLMEDWSRLDSAEQDKKFAILMATDRATDFDMSVAPLMRLTLIQLSDASFRGLWSFHHALLDGRSFPLLLREILDHYDGSKTPSEVPKDFFEFSHYLENQPLDDAEKFWRETLTGLEGSTPVDYPYKEVVDQPIGSAIERRLSPTDTRKLRDLASMHQVSLNTLVQAAWAIVVSHWTQKEDVVFGVVRACRHAIPDIEQSLGLFINTLPMRLACTAGKCLPDFLAEVRHAHIAMRDYETTPLDKVLQWSPLSPGVSLFNSILMYDEATLDVRMNSESDHAKQVRRFEYVGQTNFPLTLLAYGDDEMLVRLEYQRSEFTDSSAARLLDHVCNLLQSFAANPQAEIKRLPYLGAPETKQLAQWNATATPYELDTTLPELFERQVEKTPDAVAISFDGEELTYTQFNTRVNQLAHHLIRTGIKAETVVGVFLDRSIDMLVAIHGISKAGAAYVPLDIDHPVDRLSFMLEDTSAPLVIAQNNVASRLPDGVGVLCLDDPLLDLRAESGENPAIARDSSHLAYVLYTSGSTGRPKGVMNEHRGIVNRLLWMQQAFQIGPGDVVLQKTPTSFDVSVWELFWSFLVGAHLEVAKPDGHKDANYLAKRIQRVGATTLHFVPSMLQLFLEDPAAKECSTVRRVICSGEALTKELQDRFFATLPNAELHNLYGPTEAAIDVSWWACDAQSALNIVPIGKTIANTQLHVLDAALQQVPLGVAGELHIGGVQVARGYINRPDLTTDRFITDPFSPDEANRLYKTGDLARFMPDGNIEYLGRLDFQVKVRGFRIELGEIESVITQHPDMREAVVVAWTDPAGETQLVAYVVPSGSSEFDSDELTRALQDKLASYMVPTIFVSLAELPLSANGKVDRKQLPDPKPIDSDNFVGARNNVEESVATVWKDILGLDSISVTHTFFELGGNSLLLMRLANRLSTEMKTEVSIASLLRFTTVEQQVRLFDGQSAGDSQSDSSQPTQVAERQRKALASRRRRRPGART